MIGLRWNAVRPQSLISRCLTFTLFLCSALEGANSSFFRFDGNCIQDMLWIHTLDDGAPASGHFYWIWERQTRNWRTAAIGRRLAPTAERTTSKASLSAIERTTSKANPPKPSIGGAITSKARPPVFCEILSCSFKGKLYAVAVQGVRRGPPIEGEAFL